MMDSNNGVNHIGIGEREGRIFSNLVKRRNFGLVHGIGRYFSLI
jgi:O-phospho-L-seryl-tRNASec:L-selenocysteinyl-tRNA synthase